jgi:hypothetical protein
LINELSEIVWPAPQAGHVRAMKPYREILQRHRGEQRR